MAALSRAALSTGMGRARAQAGAPISTTGAAMSPSSGAFGGMGGLDGFYAQQQAMQAGVEPGTPSGFTDPLTGINTYGQNVTGGRSFYGPERLNERFNRFQSRQLQRAMTTANRPQTRLPSGNLEVPVEERGPEYYREQRNRYLEQRNRYLGNPMMFSQQGGLRSAASRALMG